MFTGIITDIGAVRSIEPRGDLRVVIGSAYDMTSVAIGASIACSGVCLTVVDKGDDWFAVDVSAETRSVAAPLWSVGTRINLERALRVGDELGGHIVTGHVDGVGRIAALAADGDSRRITVAAPLALAPFVAPKGSVALNGVSLTVNSVDRATADAFTFGLNIIPHTLQWTSFGEAAVGDPVNIEIDLLARYMRRMLDIRM